VNAVAWSTDRKSDVDEYFLTKESTSGTSLAVGIWVPRPVSKQTKSSAQDQIARARGFSERSKLSVGIGWPLITQSNRTTAYLNVWQTSTRKDPNATACS